VIIVELFARINLFEVMFFVLSNIKVPFIRRLSLTKQQITMLERKLHHGDLVFGRRDWFLKNIVIKGRYKHVGIWDAEHKVVLEMQDDGYTETPWEIFCARYTEVAAGSCAKFTAPYCRKFVEQMRTFSDKDYDAKFSWNTHSMYCSESVFHADIGRHLGYYPEPFFWKVVFIPNTLWTLSTMRKNFILTTKGLKLS